MQIAGSKLHSYRFLSSSLILLCALSASVAANSTYYRHVVFDNSLTPETYFNSFGSANGSSFLETQDWRLPVESKTFLTPPNAIRLQWQSENEGGWEAEVRLDGFRNRLPKLVGNTLYLWCFSAQPIAADDLPALVLSSMRSGLQVAEIPASFTEPLSLGKYAGDIPAGKWVEIRIPLADFRTGSSTNSVRSI